ncbi:UDP-N-acetylglucosamine 1-carboxyvinyltransferase [Dethiobacter alkaliphilus]|uniref:UDP-N-acetylglucosamine 1-carboxyvinyltransferase n=1 Tax=Dethiobacter alkaliphilus AHT 1 TaxID=555088 RepID=C0GGV3_DETAL|nr:UDP-N-acetylglucosamine 1-carboxyvinyltransferase [Dethiobacter alkaliphilus]EEG77544.1 UDP-N-acetylglucosamine 1-carboxyvinyltransferase [Dethiobacter alkaliphilus AHT 1]
MSALITLEGGVELSGRVRIEGAKNACLPIIAASLLCEDRVILHDIPPLDDVHTMCQVLNALGAETDYFPEEKKLIVDPQDLGKAEAPYDLVRKMRASFLVIGPLLARYGRARVSLPGGCAIGIRPIDLHLKGLKAMGAEVVIGHGFIETLADKLCGERVYLDFPSVGATENIMMAASLAEGVTVIENAAEEPEVVDLARFINAMGGKVTGAGTDTIRITGVSKLSGTEYTVIPDRIEAGTFMLAAAITGGSVTVENVIPEHITPLIAKLKETECDVSEEDGLIHIQRNGPLRAVDVKTLPYPGFPTDLQSPMMALLTRAQGTSVVTETVFENRFMHVDELCRMGARIKIEGHCAVVSGRDKLMGAPVNATDLRAGAALVLAGLSAQGQTRVGCVYHIDRGYWNFVEKLQSLGAKIKRSEQP